MEMDDIKFYKIYKQHKEDAEKKLKRNLSQEEKNLMKKMMLEEGAKRGILTDRLKKVAVAAGIISAAAVVGVGAKTVIDTHSNKQSDAEIENANANESVNMNEKTLEVQDEEIDIFEEVKDIYNEKYPDTKISMDDLGIIQSNSNGDLFLGTLDDGTKNYAIDSDLIAYQDTTSAVYEKGYVEINRLGEDATVYVVVDKRDNSTITAMGKLQDTGIVPITVEKLDTFSGPVYENTGKQIDISKDNEEENKKTYDALADKYQERLAEINAQQRDDDGR